MDEIDHKLLVGMEKGITLTAEPFKDIALQLGITPTEVVTRLRELKEKGVIRRFGASIKPNNVGFSANALVAWEVPEKQTQEIGAYLSKYHEISHCYQRKPVEGKWDFNLYTVIHGKERETVQGLVKEISKGIGINEYKILFSIKDLKRKSSLGSSSVIPAKNVLVLSKNSQETDES